MKFIPLAHCLLIVGFVMAGTVSLHSQTTETKSTDTLNQALEKVKSALTLLNRLKVSGYIQAQFQLADTAGIQTFNGGNFPANADNRFSIRRGRVKFTYDYLFSQYVLQLDVTERGVAARDVWVALTDPWLKCFTLTGGIFSRPFGFEIEYSSGLRELPERTRMIQTLFTGERDLGAKITFQPPATSPWHMVRAVFSVTNGTGANMVDFDRFKDYIGRLSINDENKSGTLRYGLGVSYLNGGWRPETPYRYRMEDFSGPSGNFSAFFLDRNAQAGSRASKQYFGADAQLALTTPLGETILRGEYITGLQAGTFESSATPITQPMGAPFSRNFRGACFYWIQNIGHSPLQTTLRYDFYDPNTAVSGNRVGEGSGIAEQVTGVADIRFSTLGMGLVWNWNSQVKICAWYEIVRNETTDKNTFPDVYPFVNRDRQDNLLTIRVQYRL